MAGGWRRPLNGRVVGQAGRRVDWAIGAVVIQNGRVSIESGCDPTPVRLVATIIEDGEPCRRLFGALFARKTAGMPVGATRSVCGDGIVDPGSSETCDPPGTSCSAV